MDYFLSNDDIVATLTAGNKATLVVSHKFIHYSTEAGTNDLSNHFITYVTEGNRPEVLYALRVLNLRNKSKMSVVNALDK